MVCGSSLAVQGNSKETLRNQIGMASTLVVMASNLLAMASTLVAMASNLIAMAMVLRFAPLLG